MQLKQFYQTTSAEFWSLYLYSQEEWEGISAKGSAHEKQLCLNQAFDAKTGALCILTDNEGCINKIYLGTGLGRKEDESRALAQAARSLLPGTYKVQKSLAHEVALSWALAQYRFLRYKNEENKPRILILEDEEHYKKILIDADAVFLVRDLINTPANDMGPSHLAYAMSELAHAHEANFTQWIGQDLLSSNFPAIHAVGRASSDAPRLLSMTWGERSAPHVVLIGKGVCFDSGGLDIKPANYMRLMKKDMGGAAHALALAQWIIAHRLPIHLEVLIPAVENAVGSEAFRPGDVLTMRNGLTVEVDNTDAEGRLILADALAKASEEKPALIIDFATLTGAARSAVGTEIAAFFTNNDDLAQQLSQYAQELQDPVWRLPLFSGYESLLDSPIADLANCSPSPFAGAITAALFLQRFVTKDISWIHFDIMAWNERAKPGRPEGGEAMGLRALAYYLKDRFGR